MKIEGKEYRTIWFENNFVKIIDQTKLPHKFIIKELKTFDDAVNAIKNMEVRGAPLIGATAAYAIVLAIKENNNLNLNNQIFVTPHIGGMTHDARYLAYNRAVDLLINNIKE